MPLFITRLKGCTLPGSQFSWGNCTNHVQVPSHAYGRSTPTPTSFPDRTPVSTIQHPDFRIVSSILLHVEGFLGVQLRISRTFHSYLRTTAGVEWQMTSEIGIVRSKPRVETRETSYSGQLASYVNCCQLEVEEKS